VPPLEIARGTASEHLRGEDRDIHTASRITRRGVAARLDAVRSHGRAKRLGRLVSIARGEHSPMLVKRWRDQVNAARGARTDHEHRELHRHAIERRRRAFKKNQSIVRDLGHRGRHRFGTIPNTAAVSIAKP